MENVLTEPAASHIRCEKCGKIYSKSGIKSHQKWCKGSIESKSTSVEGSERVDSRVEIDSKSTRFEGSNKYNEVNMKEQYDNKKEQIEPSKPEALNEEYECGACHAHFGKRHKFCPECGVGFE